MKNRNEIEEKSGKPDFNRKRKRIRECNAPLVDEALFIWFKQLCVLNSPANRLVLKEKAELLMGVRNKF